MSDSSTPFHIWILNIFVKILVDLLILLMMFVRKQINLVIVVCWLSLSMVCLLQLKHFNDGNNNDGLEYIYSVNELLFYLTNDILLLREKDAGAHCPLLVTIEPSDMSKKREEDLQHWWAEETEGS